MWKIEKFRVFTGANLKTKFSKVPCVSQIECQSNKINQYNDDYYSRHTCWISFVDGVPPANVCYPVDYGNLTPPTTAAFGSELN